jgi:hypothetical protein
MRSLFQHGLMILTAVSLYGIDVYVESSEGDLFCLSVEGDESLEGLQEYLSKSVNVPKNKQTIVVKETKEDLERKPTKIPRSYDRSLTGSEKKDIALIVNTLAEKSLMSLWGYRTTLEEAGDRVNNVHPLSFFLYVFTDPHLKENMKGIKKRGGIVWGDFIGGMAESFVEESKRKNVTETQISDFAEKVKVPEKPLILLAKENKWSDFISFVIKEMPQSQKPARYTP